MFSKWIRLIRVRQWYKNILIFAALFFSGNLFNVNLIINCIIGFFALNFISSAGYIINDIIDIKRDIDNKKKPLAQKEIKIFSAILIGIILFSIANIMLYFISIKAMLLGLILFISIVVYSVILKKLMFIDIISISSNFVIRALVGVFLINAKLSPWFLIIIFCMASYLVTGKRIAELNFKSKKNIIKSYEIEFLKKITLIYFSIILVVYFLYANFENHFSLIFIFPILLYILLIIQYHIEKGDKYIQNFELLFLDKHFLISSIIFSLIAGGILYL